MKEVKKLIESGVLEQYVLGNLPQNEERALEEKLAAHPALRAHVDQLELSLEKIGLENAVAPPAHLKEDIFEKIAPARKNIETC